MVLVPSPQKSSLDLEFPDRLRTAVIGYGYWGPNLARNLDAHAGIELRAIADMNPNRLTAARAKHPWTRLSTDARGILASDEIDAVVIATPPETHCDLAIEALENGKHVLVEKPLATNPADAERMASTASKCGKALMVDHTFLFTGAVRRIKEYIDCGEIGEVHYFDSTRINLGLFQTQSNVVWDLAPHDISILLHLLPESVREVSAIGASHVDAGLENIAYITLRFDSELLAHFHVNWLAPVKIRKTIIGGSKRMVVYDDTEPSEKVKLYDSGASRLASGDDAYSAFVEYRKGDVVSPKLDRAEALSVECDHFLKVVRGECESISDGALGIEVVRILAAAEASIRRRGAPVEVVR